MCVPDRSSCRAFSLAELIIVVVCMGILGSLAAGGIGNLMQVGREEAALGRARLLNAARSSYSLSRSDAERLWAQCGTDQQRFQLLSEAQALEGEAAEYLSSPGGYTLVLSGPLRGRTLVLKNGAQLAYR